MSGMTCYHLPWKAHAIELRQELHDIISLGQPTRSYYVSLGNAIIALGQHTQSDDEGR